MRSFHHADHIGLKSQKQAGLLAVGRCVPTGRVNPEQLDELARLSDLYGNGEIRLTTGQNAIIPNVFADRVTKLLNEPLLKQLSPRPSPFMRGLVACVGTDQSGSYRNEEPRRRPFPGSPRKDGCRGEPTDDSLVRVPGGLRQP